MDPEDIDISADDRPMGGPPNSVPEPTTDEFDLFQKDFMSYSQLMRQMSLDPDAGTSGTQYDAPLASFSEETGNILKAPL
jgi:hypothetical protein